jgi:glutathione S-transferase
MTGQEVVMPVSNDRIQNANPRLVVYTFGAQWGLPTCGPFGLKLEACLRMLDVPYRRVHENDSRKGPKRKSPWIEDGDVRLGDTELILEHVQRSCGKHLDEGLTAAELASAHVLRGMLEERYHQIFEYELAVLDDGFAELKKVITAKMPSLLAPIAATMVRRSITQHLFERGIARHAPEEVAAMGRADIDALSAWLGDREWFVADRPTRADAIAFGLLAVSIRSPLPTPVCTYARTKPNLVAFVDRALSRFFPEQAQAPVPLAAE